MIQKFQMRYPPTEKVSQRPKTIVPTAADSGTDHPDLHDRCHADGPFRGVRPPDRDDEHPEDDHARDVRERAQEM